MSQAHKISQVLYAALLLSCFFNLRGGMAFAQESALTKPLVPVWRFETPRLTTLSPATAAGRIYTPLANGEIVALTGENGMRLWQAELGGAVSASLFAEDEVIYVATRNSNDSENQSASSAGTLRCLSSTGGLTRWVKDLPVALTGNFGISGSHLFAVDSRGDMLSFEKATGALQWSTQHNLKFTTNIIIDDARLYVGSSDGTIYALDQKTGSTVWRQKTPTMLSTIGRNNQRIFAGTSNGRVYAFDSVSGSPLWRKSFGGTIRFIAAARDGIIITSLNNSVYHLDAERGKRLWKRQLSGRTASAPLVSGDAILLAPLAGEACSIISISTGKIINTIQFESGVNAIAHPILAEKTLVLTTNGGVIGYSASSANLSRSNQ